MKNIRKNIYFIVIVSVICVLFFIILFNNSNNKEILEGNIKKYSLSNADYTKITLNDYNNSLDSANSILNNLFVSKKDVIVVSEELEKSFYSLEILPDKTELIKKYNYYIEFDLSEFTPNSLKKYNYILNNVKTVLDNENSTVVDVNNSLNKINKIETVLVLKADKSELMLLNNKLLALDKTKYVSNSISFLDDALVDIENILNDDNVSNEIVQENILKYNDDFNKLILKGNKTNFNKLVQQVKNINKSNYTTTSYNNLINTLNEIDEVISNDDFSQKEIDEAYNKLKTSFNQLKKYTRGVFQITISYNLLSNNSVGHDWIKTTYYSGDTFYSGNKITSNLNSTIYLTTKIIEDDTYPDVGSSTISLVLKDGYTTSSTITITENRGRYTGNTAKWKVTYNVKCLEKK